MVLPLLAGLAGTAAAGTLGMSPLIASALGSGLGSFIETGDIKQAATTGLGSLVGGQMLGGTVGGMMGTTAPAAATAGAGAAGAAGAGAAGAAGASPGLLGGLGDLVPEGVRGFMSNPENMKGIVGAVAGPAMTYDPYADQGGGGGSAMAEEGGYTPGRAARIAPTAGRGETNYGFSRNYGLQEGGPVQPGMTMGMGQGQPSEKDVISDAIAAIEGRHPAPEVALGLFLQAYGEDALMELVASVRRGDMQANQNPDDNMVYGPAVGDDMVPARNADTGEELLLESGEYVVPKEATANLGVDTLDMLSERAMA